MFRVLSFHRFFIYSMLRYTDSLLGQYTLYVKVVTNIVDEAQL